MVLADTKDKVTVLITAESIIAGFMIAYGASVGPNLLYWSNLGHPGSLFTTYLAAMLIYGVVLTCFVSILLLFKSLDAEEESDVRYRWGYYLFIWAILVSCVFVGINTTSVYIFTVSTIHKPLDLTTWFPGSWSDSVAATYLVVGFFGYVVFLVVVWIVAWGKARRRRADRCGTWLHV